MVLTNLGRNLIRDDVEALLTTSGIGLDDTNETRTDTEILGGGTTIDALEATTGWSESGTGSALSLNSTAGEFQQGSACANMPASAGNATWTKTVTSFDATNGFVVMWLYFDNAADLDDSTSAVQIQLGTGGTTNTNIYNFDDSLFSNGWNSVICDLTASPDSTAGTGADEADIDTIQITVDLAFNQNTNDMRMDYWRYYEPDVLGITDSQRAPTITKGDYYLKSSHTINFSESNGLDIVEAGDSDGTNLVTRQTFAAFRKADNVQATIEKYYYIDQE